MPENASLSLGTAAGLARAIRALHGGNRRSRGSAEKREYLRQLGIEHVMTAIVDFPTRAFAHPSEAGCRVNALVAVIPRSLDCSASTFREIGSVNFRIPPRV